MSLGRQNIVFIPFAPNELKGRGHFESLLYNFNILMGKSMKNHVVEKFERKKSFKIRYFKNNDKNCVWLKPNYYSNPIFQIHFYSAVWRFLG